MSQKTGFETGNSRFVARKEGFKFGTSEALLELTSFSRSILLLTVVFRLDCSRRDITLTQAYWLSGLVMFVREGREDIFFCCLEREKLCPNTTYDRATSVLSKIYSGKYNDWLFFYDGFTSPVFFNCLGRDMKLNAKNVLDYKRLCWQSAVPVMEHSRTDHVGKSFCLINDLHYWLCQPFNTNL
jgi:hypothetical protein